MLQVYPYVNQSHLASGFETSRLVNCILIYALQALKTAVVPSLLPIYL